MSHSSKNRRDLYLPTRRAFLQRCAVATAGLIVLPRFARASPSWSNGDPFSLGVASGTPSTGRIRVVDAARAATAVERP